MMQTVFQNVLTASFHGGIIIGVTIILRLLLNKTPKKFICLLWLLAFARLLMPVEIQAPISLQPDPETIIPVAPIVNEYVANTGDNESTHIKGTPFSPQLSSPPEASRQEVQSVAANQSINWMGVLAWGWLSIIGCFGIYMGISYYRLKHRVRFAVRIPGGWECENIDTAFILGFIRPEIYIPMGMSREDRRHILAHERTHLEKGDHWLKMLGFLALAVHWFNPLVWMAYILFGKDMELACDERVIRFMELEERKAYSAALLRCSASKSRFAPSPVAFGEVSVKSRIRSVLKYRKPSFWGGLAGIVAIVFVTVCLMTSPNKAAEIDTGIPNAETSSVIESTDNQVPAVNESTDDQAPAVTILNQHRMDYPGDGAEYTVYIAVSPVEKEIFLIKEDVNYFCTEEDLKYPISYHFTNADGLPVSSRWDTDEWYDEESKTAYLKLRIVRPEGSPVETPIVFWYAYPEMTTENPTGTLRLDPNDVIQKFQRGKHYYIQSKDIFTFTYIPVNPISVTVDLNIPMPQLDGELRRVEIQTSGMFWDFYIPGITDDWATQPNSEFYRSSVESCHDYVRDSYLNYRDGSRVPVYAGEGSSVLTSDEYRSTFLLPNNVVAGINLFEIVSITVHGQTYPISAYADRPHSGQTVSAAKLKMPEIVEDSFSYELFYDSGIVYYYYVKYPLGSGVGLVSTDINGNVISDFSQYSGPTLNWNTVCSDGNGGLYVCHIEEIRNETGAKDASSQLLHIASDGTWTTKANFDNWGWSDNVFPDQLILDNDGRLYIRIGGRQNRLEVFSLPDMTFLFELKEVSPAAYLVKQNDGSVVVVQDLDENDDFRLLAVDAEQKCWGEERVFSHSWYRVFSGNMSYMLLAGDSAVFAYDWISDSSTHLFDWMDVGLSAGAIYVYGLDENSILCMARTAEGNPYYILTY